LPRSFGTGRSRCEHHRVEQVGDRLQVVIAKVARSAAAPLSHHRLLQFYELHVIEAVQCEPMPRRGWAGSWDRGWC